MERSTNLYCSFNLGREVRISRREIQKGTEEEESEPRREARGYFGSSREVPRASVSSGKWYKTLREYAPN